MDVVNNDTVTDITKTIRSRLNTALQKA